MSPPTPFPSQEADEPLWEGEPRSRSVAWSAVAGLLDRLNDLADRLGTSTTALVVGTLVTVIAATAAVVAVTAGGSSPPELSIPYASSTTTTSSDETGGASGDDPSEGPAEVMVHAAGAVSHPGVYVLGDDARVGDLLAAAGGPAAGADLDRVNLAAPLSDGTRVYVPEVGEDEPPSVLAGSESPGAESGGAGTDPGTLIDLNRATATELERLPGIGPATASSIIEHRERHGPFARVDDLLSVRGIGDAKLAALRDLVHV
ncbi:MAG: ComEA family DNA-binding protein [Acidimicrobiales bacterium]